MARCFRQEHRKRLAQQEAEVLQKPRALPAIAQEPHLAKVEPEWLAPRLEQVALQDYRQERAAPKNHRLAQEELAPHQHQHQ